MADISTGGPSAGDAREGGAGPATRAGATAPASPGGSRYSGDFVARAAARRRRSRLTLLAVAGVTLAAALGLTLFALQDQIVFFKTPSDIAAEPLAVGERVRIGGLVKEGSVVRTGSDTAFRVTDTAAELAVTHSGILPDLFREGQGVVLDGAVRPDGVFVADTVLAKHDENYVPAEVAEALERQGVWRGDVSVVIDEGAAPTSAPTSAFAPTSASTPSGGTYE